jgi:hypothetical protein
MRLQSGSFKLDFQHVICVTFWDVIRRLTWMIATRTEPRCTSKAQIPKARIPLLIREWGNPSQRPSARACFATS